MTIKVENDQDDESSTRTTPGPENPVFDISSKTEPQSQSKENTVGWNEDILDRIDMLRKRYGMARPGTEELKPGDFFHHWKTDSRKVNQGHCYYNERLDTFYCRPREFRAHKKNSHLDTIYFEIERESIHTGHDTISFHIEGQIIHFFLCKP